MCPLRTGDLTNDERAVLIFLATGGESRECEAAIVRRLVTFGLVRFRDEIEGGSGAIVLCYDMMYRSLALTDAGVAFVREMES